MIKLSGSLTNRLLAGSAFSMLVLMSGCSFHSSQWEAMKRLLKPSEIMTEERWFLSGPVSDRRVYPVQASGAIMFTDGEEIILQFDGWHFVEIRGLPGIFSETISENSVDRIFYYSATKSFNKDAEKKFLPAQKSMVSGYRKRIIYEVRCEAWQQVPALGGELLSQSCLFKNGVVFSNSILLDTSGNIRAIESVLGPGGNKVHVAIRDL